eukprot:CAMPEP_0198553454 /NCGR_PEP_ID=MMETSP1462-20131121/80587_1 /TAXON_ID=1333877 /ORGANISM="Brandtodinium nutriculum, Strain RCC3387" /LENGTH=111 /DNA_ID=CAMNT_0044284141 /DNA_START=75 /DNA_END=407 /DNA_ORIENTATION=-
MALTERHGRPQALDVRRIVTNAASKGRFEHDAISNPMCVSPRLADENDELRKTHLLGHLAGATQELLLVLRRLWGHPKLKIRLDFPSRQTLRIDTSKEVAALVRHGEVPRP